MRSVTKAITRLGEFIAAMMMAAMFATFILQVFIRYTARIGWVAETIPFFDPNLYGWTLEFCLVLWIWLVFWGSALIVRERSCNVLSNSYQRKSENKKMDGNF